METFQYEKPQTDYLNPEKTFFFLSLIFGFLFLTLTPPFQVPDENVHFFRAYQFSEGNLFGGILPKSLTITTSKFEYLPFHPERKVKPEVIFSLLRLPLESHVKSDYFRNNLSPIAYLPQVIGIELGRIFDLSPLLLMYFGRTVNLFVWIFLIFTAIKTTPIFKWLFCLLALSPMALFQAASLSKDSFTIGASFLVIALSLQYA